MNHIPRLSLQGRRGLALDGYGRCDDSSKQRDGRKDHHGSHMSFHANRAYDVAANGPNHQDRGESGADDRFSRDEHQDDCDDLCYTDTDRDRVSTREFLREFCCTTRELSVFSVYSALGG